MKVLTWNANRAGASREALWGIVRREPPDIGLLQELTGIPAWVEDRYHGHPVVPRFFRGNHDRFATAILSRWPMDTTPFLSSLFEWVNMIHRERYGWLLGCEVIRDGGERLRLVSVHSPALAVPREDVKDVDVSPIKPMSNSELWFTEILRSLHCNADLGGGTQWIVSGDFNNSPLFRSRLERYRSRRVTAAQLVRTRGNFVPSTENPDSAVQWFSVDEAAPPGDPLAHERPGDPIGATRQAKEDAWNPCTTPRRADRLGTQPPASLTGASL